MHIGRNIILVTFLMLSMPFTGLSSETTVGMGIVDSIRMGEHERAPVVLYGDTLFYIHASFGSYQPAERAKIIERRLQELIEAPEFESADLTIREQQRTTNIHWKDRIVFGISDQDAAVASQSRQELAGHYLDLLTTSLQELIEKRSLWTTLVQSGLVVLEVVVLALLWYFSGRFHSYLTGIVRGQQGKFFDGIKIRNYELLSARQQLRLLLGAINALRWTVVVFVVYFALPVLFSILPWTRGWAEKLFSYVLDPLTNIFLAFVHYLPNLFAIAVIYFITHQIVRLVRYLTNEIESGELVIKGFHTDWARPTFHIVRFFLYAFMFISVFPYIPGSDSKVFQGVSVFIGAVFSLGSSSSISNIIAGLVITYMRPFQIGDRIRIGEVTGDVVEKTILVTRLRTTKNEEVTIPNSKVLSGHTVNYHTVADVEGLVLHTTVTIGYDVPWRKVHELLTGAALATEYVLKEGAHKPYVLQTGLQDFYISYELNAFTNNPEKMPKLYSGLHQNIQDAFNEAGIEILSPHYRVQRVAKAAG